ncbi:NADH-quinone oxidoreductase subunit M [Nocardioides sp. JQ2195]|uniref:NADH-quinone oxidoreductase subunit M n=1 Tax=Nocardioides sp. JQ2195 TaxID=2592334 RepID=UPI00143E94B2|nr:NADH-quinone oxidoreductase subunit M [Nocardioides sp. JQ2195]QIX28114.1 NADH-quinone oxidoreductase subunit M [Nocardioides sp. JQ2195]
MNDFPWLSLIILLPLVGGLVTALLPATGSALPKQVALGTATLTFVLSLVVACSYEPGDGFQFVELHDWIPAFGTHYAVAVDGIGLTLVLLTTLLVPVVVLASWNDADVAGGTSRAPGFFGWMLALEGLALVVFMAQDVFLFYVAFEATLIPAYFLVGHYGHVDKAVRAKAAVKFLLYMLAGGLIMLASVVGLYAVSAQAGHPTYLIGELAALDLDKETGRWLFLGFFIAFAIKAPLFPVHTWLPDTTAAATPGTSVLLICVLDKIGTYGMLRFCLGLFPEASKWATPVVVVLALISIIYGALIAIGQDDMLRLIGLTSLSHFGFIVLGVFVMNSQGMTGATFYMFNHGLATAVLFLVAGYLIRRRGSTLISDHGGVEKVAPVLAGLFLVGGLGTLGLPGLSPFVSEFLVLVGGFAHHWVTGAFAVTGIVLAAIYVLWMYQKLMTGPTVPGVVGMKDVNAREIGAVAPLVVAMLIFGFYPKPMLDIINPAVEGTMSVVGVSDDDPVVTPVDAESSQEGQQ